MADIVYSTRRSGFEPKKVYRNPRYFGAPLASEGDTVTVEGDWPAVVAAYKAFGIDAGQVGVTKQPEGNDDDQESLIAQLKERGINRDKRTSVEKLRELLAESYEEERAELSKELAGFGVEHDATRPLDELRALLVTAKNEAGGE